MAEDPKQPAMNDVAKPGTTPPDASSKPVIVGHTSVVADPMVSKQPEPATATVAGSMKQRIMPTATGEAVQKQAAKEDDTAHAEAEVPKKDTTADKQARLGDIIESGEYNVSIKQKKSSSAALTFFATILGIVTFAAIVLFVLIDLKIIDVGINLPFEIFK